MFASTKRLTALLAASLMFVLAGCGGAQPSNNTGSGSTGGSGGTSTPSTSTPAPAPAPTTPELKELTIGFVPSQEAAGISDKVKPMEDYLTAELGIPVKSFVGTNFVAVIEGMGAKTVDVAFLNPFGYVLASGDYDAQVILKSVRRGSAQYRAQMVTRTEDNIPVCAEGDTKCADTFAALKGKKLAFVDPASTSGYLFPASFMMGAGLNLEKGQDFTDVIFAGAHDNAAKSVLNKTVDAAWTFEDVRDNLKAELPNIMEQLTVVAYTEWIPNDTVTVGSHVSADLTAKIKAALVKYASTDEGKAVLKELYTIDGLVDAKDEDYDVIRNMAENMGINVRAQLGGN